MHDAVQFERAGIPSTAIITDKFRKFAAIFAENLSMPDYPVVSMPHPLGTRSDDELRELAGQMAQQLIDNLVLREP